MSCAFSWATRPATADGRDPDGNQAGGDIACAVIAPDAVRLLIGDVMGHDPRAAQTAAEVTRAFRQLAVHPDPLPVVAARLHAFVADHADGEEFVTAQFVSIPDSDDDAQIVCCGHPPPLLLRDGSAAFIEPYAAPPLGLLDLAEGWCRASMIPVGDGDQLLLYTDGVSEARDAAGQFFPLAQVTADTVRGTGPDRAPLLDVMVAGLDEHVGDRACDDILLLLVTMR